MDGPIAWWIGMDWKWLVGRRWLKTAGAKKRIAISAVSTFIVFLLSRTFNVGHSWITDLTTNWQRTASAFLPPAFFLHMRPRGSRRKPLREFKAVHMLLSSAVPGSISTILIMAVASAFNWNETGFVLRIDRFAWRRVELAPDLDDSSKHDMNYKINDVCLDRVGPEGLGNTGVSLDEIGQLSLEYLCNSQISQNGLDWIGCGSIGKA